MEKQLHSKIEFILKNDLNFLNVHIGDYTDLTTREMKVVWSCEAFNDLKKTHHSDAFKELITVIASEFCLEIFRYINFESYKIAEKLYKFNDDLLNSFDIIIASPEIIQKYFKDLTTSKSNLLFLSKLTNTMYQDLLMPFNRMIMFKKDAIQYYTKNILTIKENNRVDHDFRLELNPKKILVVELGDLNETKN